MSTATNSQQEEEQSSEVPYITAQPTPSATAAKMASGLPPIAMAQPLGNISQIQTHLPGGSNIPVNPNAPAPVYDASSVDPNRPYVVMAMAPTAVTGDADADNLRFAFLQKCRWLAGFMLAYYVATILFLQPFILGTLGLTTAFIGYYGARPPVDAQRLKWLRWYVWANYIMLILNMWMLIVALLFSGRMVSYDDDNDSASSDADDNETYYYYSSSTGLFVGLLVAANTIVHLRCMRMAQLLIGELVAAGVDRHHGPVVVLTSSNPTTAV
ncbi:Signal peptidase complex subunit 3 [Phytophthora boehmeriae]|uniref:Signal peptidase complex subunit 3 n=1 Tax=Phytophthora boehmeriae TaxID=109152 RepID=A0A8T1WQJ1_9STRA|nr:Signal peptidase complex subunit 3 [Phytophthora boehmeriae]